MPIALVDITIKIDGTATEALDLVDVVIQTDVNMPDMCVVTLADFSPGDPLTPVYIDDTKFDIGKMLEVSVKTEEIGGVSASDGVVFKGEITALEPSFEADGRRLMVVRAYHKGHRLLRGRASETYLEKKDSEVVQALAQAAGLKVTVEATSVTHKYIMCTNQTPMETILYLAERNGYQVLFDLDHKVKFAKTGTTLGDVAGKKKWGDTLVEFRVRATAVQQATEAVAYGWDSKKLEMVMSKVTASEHKQQIGLSKDGIAASKAAFGAAQVVVANSALTTVNDAKGAATSALNRISSEYLQAEGECYGDATMRAGMVLELDGLGTRFNGKYYLTSVKHVITPSDFRTYFEINGNHPRTLSSLVSPFETGSALPGSNRIFGVVPAIVTNLKDADNLGRFKVKYPWLGDNKEVESNWVRPAMPMGGSKWGMTFLPEVNDEVLIAFENGDVNHPYMIGALWNGKSTPNALAGNITSDGKVDIRAIQTPSGHYIAFTDKQDAEKIEIVDKSGSNKIVIDTKGKEISIFAENKITIQTKEFVLEGTDKIDFKGKEISAKANANFKVDATQGIEMKATSKLALKGTGGVAIEAAGSKIEMTGPIVKVNNGALEVM